MPQAAAPLLDEDPAALTARTARILIVDDRPDKLLAMESALGPLGHEIVLAGSGREALRWLLRDDFAVVLLDVNMPGMDGFETARLIRHRRRNHDTPIIFITSYGDEMHALHGYSLGAVDFILSPIIPAVLRSKVGVFLELHERTGLVRRQAQRLLVQTEQLQGLTRASLQIHAAPSIRQTLQVAADSARSILEVRRAAAVVLPGPNGLREPEVAFAPAPRSPAAPRIEHEGLLAELMAGLSKPARLEPADLAAPALGALLPGEVPPGTTGLIAPLVGRDGTTTGLLVVAGKREGDFSDDDEALLVQLSRMAATAIENTLFADARESNRIKDEFLATLSHELRTPLSSILGWAQLLRTQMLDADETTEALEIIERNADIQCKLIEELLDVSRIVTGKLQLQLQPVALAEIIQAAVHVIRPAAQARRVAIDVALEPHADGLRGDADRLQQVFWNLLSNAVKFTPPGGQIRVSLEVSDAEAHVAVADDGEGIAPEFLPYIFDRFRQADSTTSRRHGGLGIGLAIVRHIVELHGGTVWAESGGKGRGTRIVVTLPFEPPRDATEQAGSGRLARELPNPLAGQDREPILHARS